jgi:hypothetical protein
MHLKTPRPKIFNAKFQIPELPFERRRNSEPINLDTSCFAPTRKKRGAAGKLFKHELWRQDNLRGRLRLRGGPSA